MKKFSFILFLLLIYLFPFTKVVGVVNPTIDFYVNDYADILSEETEDYILNKSVKLNDIDGSQIVVVTVNNLEGSSIEDYSLELFNKFRIGDKHKDNGLLILISLEDREFRVIVGSGLEWLLKSQKIGQIQDEYMVPYFKNNQWNVGIKKGYDEFYNEIYDKIDINFIEKNKGVIEIILFFSNLLIGLILPFIFRYVKNKNLFKSDKKNNVKCFFIYLFLLFFIIFVEIIINIDIRILILNIINNLMIYGFVYYKINYKLSDNYYKRYDHIKSYRKNNFSRIGVASGGRSHRGGGGSSLGSGSSRKF